MSVRVALRRALSETYQFSWRLLVVNTVLSAVVVAVVLVVPTLPLALLLAPAAAGPIAAGLVHCVVMLVRGDDIRIADAVEGTRAHWRRGLALGALFGAGLMFGVVAVTFYASEPHRVWVLAVLAAYGTALFCLLVLAAWPLAISDPQVGSGAALRAAGLALLRRPGRALALGLAVLVVNILGAVTVVPLLTLTIAYTFLAAAHVVLPQIPPEEAT
jgi:hypothetical protein